MGLIQSVICSLTFCIERVLTWTCCAFVLMLLLFGIILLMVYGISVGYHYAQTELVAFHTLYSKAAAGRRTQQENMVPMPMRRLAVNGSEIENPSHPLLEVYKTIREDKENIHVKTTNIPLALLGIPKSPPEPEKYRHDMDLARKIIGRFRRSRHNTSRPIPFPLLGNTTQDTPAPLT